MSPTDPQPSAGDPNPGPKQDTPQNTNEENHRDPHHFPVVGIGASAGGLRALQELFRHAPAGSGIAWVVVTHLAPDQESHLAELLQSATAMPVQQVHNHLELQPDQVYVIPPNRNLATLDTDLLRVEPLEAERRTRAPIDHFLRTLAQTHRDRAVGVVLSGAGSDGTLGLARIKELGGLTVVQEPGEAEYDSMPQTAIASGHVDLVLPTQIIASRIIAYLQHMPSDPAPEANQELVDDVRELLHKILTQVQTRTGRDFSRYKRGTILRRVQHRMQIVGRAEISAYLEYMRTHDVEAQLLCQDFLITVTNFFRDSAAFAALEDDVIPALFADKTPHNAVRVWVAGCATGEEAYSLAILLMEYASRLDSPPGLKIFASDLSEPALRLARFFVLEAGGYRVREEVRECVVFTSHNLLKDAPFSRIDLISCRNLLIYLERTVQQQVVELFAYALRPGGYLFLGSAETLERGELFHRIDKTHHLYQRLPGSLPQSRLPLLALQAQSPNIPPLPAKSLPAAPTQNVPSASYQQMHERMLDRFAPPSLLVNHDHAIVYYGPGVHRYLDTPVGEPTHQVLQRVRAELRPELTAALLRAFGKKEPSHCRPVIMVLDDAMRRVTLGVWPAGSGEMQGLVLVFFHESEVQPPAEGVAEMVGDRDVTIRELDEELTETKRQLAAALEEYETSLEEMKASNEELQSMNEELRATAEELETSREELQSINEELITVNQENKHKVDELSQLSNDLQNLLAATDIAILFLDRELRITRFTPSVSELFNVLASDRGRPVAHLTHQLEYDHLMKDVETVLRTLAPSEREVRSKTGRLYLMRLRPYRTLDDHIGGVVVTFVDISQIKQAEAALQTLNETLEAQVLARTAQVRELASHLLIAEQQVQARIARLLHDDLQQQLYSAMMHLKVLEGEPPSSAAQASLEELQTIMGQVLSLIRQLTTDLAPPVLHQDDLVQVFKGLGMQMQRMHGLTVTIEPQGLLPVLPSPLRLLLYQGVRELLFNVVKHAGVDYAEVHIVCTGANLQVTVVDAGRGFDPAHQQEAAHRRNSYGLSVIADRIRWQGGWLEVKSTPGQGTRATIWLPVGGEADAIKH